MENYEIVIESSGDLTKDLRSKYHIYDGVIPGTVYLPDGSDFDADSEFINYSPEEFFKMVKQEAGQIKTAFGSYEVFARVVEPILKSGKDAIILTLSSGISGTYNGYRQWADLLIDDYPERKIVVIDSLRYSSAIGLLAIYAAKNRDEGMSFEDNIKWCEENKNRIHESGVMDDLRFLAKNGRISATKAFFGSLVSVQPFADFTFDGKNEPLGTLKGADLVDELSLNYILNMADDIENQIVIITHSCRQERAEKFKEQLLKVSKPKEVFITHVGQTCGPSIGPGLCTYFFMGSKILEGREKENNLFNKLKS